MRSQKNNKDDVASATALASEDGNVLMPLRVMPANAATTQTAPQNEQRTARKRLVNEPDTITGGVPTTKKNKSKGESKSRKAESAKFKGSRGIDTLLRNAYRAQLDMLALAATKANIMISLNGLLMSMLIISGTHLVSVNGLYIIPIAIFLSTCALATTFAVFAARPDISRKTHTYNDFMRDDAHLLVFEEFSDLHENEYIDAMTDMLDKPQRVYKNMIAHIYELGVTADKKYRNLYYSYTVFMAGTIATVVALLVLVAFRWSGSFALI